MADLNIRVVQRAGPVPIMPVPPTLAVALAGERPRLSDPTLIVVGGLLQVVVTAETIRASANTVSANNGTTTVNNDRVVRAFPTLPTLGAAGTFFTDPTFGTKIWRVTDTSTNGGATCHTPSAIGGAWNTDGTRFMLTGGGGNAMFFSFDGTTVTYQPSLTVSNQVEPWFSYVSPDVVYYNSYNGATDSYRTVNKKNLSTGVVTQVADLDAMYPGEGMTPGGFMAIVRVVDGDVLVCLFGGYGQDSHFLVHHDALGLVDSRTLVVSSTAGPVTGFLMHGIGIDRLGVLQLSPSTADIIAHPGIEQIQQYDPSTHALTPLTVRGGGHYSLGYGTMVNEDCCSGGGGYDSAQWQFRTLTALNTTSDLIVPQLTPTAAVLSDHTAWRNETNGGHKPFLSSTFRTDIPLFGSVAQRPWDNEILTIATDGSHEVRRHCHNRATYDPSDYWSQPDAHINAAGTHAIFTSNWEQTLGAGRTDVFLVRLA